MAALVESYPHQSGTVTVLQTRTTSASGIMSTSQAQGGQGYGYGTSQQRVNGRATASGAGAAVYRGTSAPIQPYAFTSTPSLNAGEQWQDFRFTRTVSTPAVPTANSYNHSSPRNRYPGSQSMTNLPSTASMGSGSGLSRDDSTIPGPGTRRMSAPRPHSLVMSVSQTPSPAHGAPVRIAPERYRRPSGRLSDSPGASGNATPYAGASLPLSTGPVYNSDARVGASRIQHGPLPVRPTSFTGPTPASTADDMQLFRKDYQDDVKRVRRRSMPALDPLDFVKSLAPSYFHKQTDESSRLEQLTPPRNVDNESSNAPINSSSSNNTLQSTSNADLVHLASADGRDSSLSPNNQAATSTSANFNPNAPTGNAAPLAPSAETRGSNPDSPKLVNIPPRNSSSDAPTTKRTANPSPLSKPVTMDSDSEMTSQAASAGPDPETPTKQAASPQHESPAVKQLSALNDKSGRPRSKTSRLRRAFSFGSAAEFKRAANTDNESSGPAAGPSKLHKEPTEAEVYDAEQDRIAQQQEAAGIGNSIYSGGKLFSRSNDNISISSTASSASIMIRKMGRGMKKSTRSLVGLFRPKSVIGAPAADAKIPEVSQASVSMITVEAERERVNVNADPHEQIGGGTGFPRLERNSIDAAAASMVAPDRLGSSGTESSVHRKSIVGGDLERAEVLAAVRKGILKHTNTPQTPSPRPLDNKGPVFDLPEVPHVSESPLSSACSSPKEDGSAHKQGDSVAIGSEDYFVSALRLRQDTKSAPGTPQGGMKRNATFNPRIAFYETWPSQEYDRRGEVATCNRLTPVLAAQIKEELNTFKMEMEVHEHSKIYTQFF